MGKGSGIDMELSGDPVPEAPQLRAHVLDLTLAEWLVVCWRVTLASAVVSAFWGAVAAALYGCFRVAGGG